MHVKSKEVISKHFDREYAFEVYPFLFTAQPHHFQRSLIWTRKSSLSLHHQDQLSRLNAFHSLSPSKTTISIPCYGKITVESYTSACLYFLVASLPICFRRHCNSFILQGIVKEGPLILENTWSAFRLIIRLPQRPISFQIIQCFNFYT